MVGEGGAKDVVVCSVSLQSDVGHVLVFRLYFLNSISGVMFQADFALGSLFLCEIVV